MNVHYTVFEKMFKCQKIIHRDIIDKALHYIHNYSLLDLAHISKQKVSTVKHFLLARLYLREIISQDLFTRLYFRDSSYILP